MFLKADQSFPLVAMYHRIIEAVTEEIGRGFVTREHKEDAGSNDLICGHRFLFVTRSDHPADDVVAWLRGPLRHYATKIVRHVARTDFGTVIFVRRCPGRTDEKRESAVVA